MDRIHDKAAKFFKDVRIKKCAMGKKAEIDCNKEQVKNLSFHNADLSSNICCYCQKVFIGPKFLVKHIFRRHPENLISLHRKCLKLETNSSGETKSLFDFIQDEFTKLKKEILIVKQVNQTSEDKLNMSKKIKECSVSSECEQQQLSGNINPKHDTTNCKNSNDDIASNEYTTNCKNSNDHIASNELRVIKEKVLDLENNVLCLQNKIEGLQKENGETLLKQEIINLLLTSENEIMKAHKTRVVELKYDLMKALQTMLNKELSQNDNEIISQFTELKEEIKKLHDMINLVKKEIDSPDYLNLIEKKLERNIINFLGNSNRCKNTVPRTRNSYYRKSLNYTGCKMSILKNKEKSLRNEPESSMKASHISRKHKNSEFYTDYELSSMLTDKMSLLGITLDTSKMSCKEYEEKMKLIEFEKKQLSKQNKHFFAIYNKINKQADERVTSKLKKKFNKIRFSEPLTMRNTVGHRHSEKNFPHQTFPILENKREVSFLASHKSVNLNSSHQELKNVKDLPVNKEHLAYNAHENLGNCDYFGNFSNKLKSKLNLQSTPLKELGACASDGNVENSNNNYFPNSDYVLYTTEKSYPVVSVLKNSGLMKRNSHENTEYMSPHSKNSLEKYMNFPDEYESSLESLSSWEDYINNS